MTRIAFLTLFLGLTLSQQKVEVSVTGPAQRVEFQLDGKVVAALTHAPWTATVDFGTHLLPRRLVARAIVDGQEIARVEQRINLPRAAAETQIVLERDDTGTPRAARLVWQSLEGESPKRVELLLDSRSIPVDGDLRAKLPAIDNAQPHLLRARLVSRLGVLSDSEIAFGGGLEDATTAELTAVGIRLRDPKQQITPADVQQWMTARGEPATVVGVEQIPGEVLIVRHPIETETSFRLDPTRRTAKRRSALSASTAGIDSLGTHPVARFMWPTVTRTGKADLLPRSQSYAFSNADEFKRILTEIGFPGAPKELRFADAVAVAGIQALAASRPRAVVLVVGESSSDASRLEPRQVREYLNAAGVPLYVWSLSGDQERWAEAEDISTPSGFTHAFDKLQHDLESQRVVWLRGNFLPTDVRVNETGSIIPLATRPPNFDAVDRAARDFMASTKTPGLAVAIVQDDHIAYAKGFGVTPHTLFQIGSLTKVFTAATILSLDKLQLDAPVSKYVSGLNPAIGKVTLAQLLSHSSGLKDEPAEYGSHDAADFAKYPRTWGAEYALLPPSTTFSYSNPGYSLAGLAAQEAVGKPYADLVQELVLTPLGMKSSTFRPSGEIASTATPLAEDTRHWPAGYMYTSANDLARFAIAMLNDGRIDGRQAIAPEVVRQIRTPRIEVPNELEPAQYGYGLFIETYHGVPTWWHAGDMPGFTAMLRILPTQHAALIVLANRQGVRLDPILDALLESQRPQPVSQNAIAMSAAEMQSYAGRYSNRFEIEIFARDGRLWVKRPGGEYALEKIGEYRFTMDPKRAFRPAELEIYPDYVNMYVWAFARKK